MANNPDWTAIAVYTTITIFVLGVLGTAIKRAASFGVGLVGRFYEHLTKGEVFHESVLTKMDALSAYAAENRDDTKKAIQEIQGVKSEVHGIKGELHGLDRRVEILEERHK